MKALSLFFLAFPIGYFSQAQSFKAEAMACASYSIHASAGAGGSIALAGFIKIPANASQEFIITAQAGHKIKQVKVDGCPVAYAVQYTDAGARGSYTFRNVRANHAIHASFVAASHHTVVASANAGGHITPSGTSNVQTGSNSPTFMLVAEPGYGIQNVLVDHRSVGPLQSTSFFEYTFYNVNNNHRIQAVFVPLTNRYTMRAAAYEGGRITPAGFTQIAYGDSLLYTVTANAGFVMRNVVIDRNASYGQLYQDSAFHYTFSRIKGNHLIEAFFAPAVNPITAWAGQGGRVTPTVANVNYASTSPVFTVTAKKGYVIDQIRLDSVPILLAGSDSTQYRYSFSNVYNPHSLQATFLPTHTTYSIASQAGLGGKIVPAGTTQLKIGKDLTSLLTADTGYAIKSIKVDGKLISQYLPIKTLSYPYPFFNVHASHTIEASFLPLNTAYTIQASAGAGGHLTAAGTSKVKYGEAREFTIQADPGYRIADLLVDGISLGAFFDDHRYRYQYTFYEVTANHTIEALFSSDRGKTYRISTWAELGNIYGPTVIDSGATQTFKIAARPDFPVALNRLMVDGYPVDPVPGYTFHYVEADHRLRADFAPVPDCAWLSAFEVPSKIPLSSLHRTYRHVFVLGTAGNSYNVDEDLGWMTIDWDLTDHCLQRLLLNPGNGNRRVDLTGATQNFASVHPSITLVGTNLGVIDNVYYATVVGDDLVLIAKSGLYGLYCTNEASAIKGCPSAPVSARLMAEDSVELPSSLAPAYPNPFSQHTTISYWLSAPGVVRLYVSDVLGKTVATLIADHEQLAGLHQVQWNSLSLPAGTYLYTLQAGQFKQTRRVVNLKGF